MARSVIQATAAFTSTSRAQGAIAQWAACIVRVRWDALQVTTSNGTAGGNIVIPQFAIADDEYGWAMVQGTGRVRTDGSGTASEALGTHTIAGELQGTTTNLVCGHHPDGGG